MKTIYDKVVRYIMSDQNITHDKAVSIVDTKQTWLVDMVDFYGETNVQFLAEQILTTDEGTY